MKYQAYLKACRVAQDWARQMSIAPELDPVKRSEFFILTGNRDSARASLANIPHPEAAYLQRAKAARHFEDRSFLEDAESPQPSAMEWLLPVLRAASSVATSPHDGKRLEKCVAASPGVAGKAAVTALTIVSNAYRNGGDLEESERLLLEAFELAPKSVKAAASPAVTRATVDLSFAKRRQTAFHDLLQDGRFWRHSLFPCSGTLLGLYRDKDFIPSDGDVDIGCLDPVAFEAVKEELRQSGCFLISPGRMASNFTARHIDGAKVDISLYVPRDSGWAKTSHVYEWRFRRFGIGELVTDYGRLPAPENVDEYLSEMYGDWWVPLSGYDSRIDSPNLSYVSPSEVCIVLASHYLATYVGKGAAAAAGWRQKLARLPDVMQEQASRFVALLTD